MQPDRITTLTDKNDGVCDVILYQGSISKSLGNKPPNCTADLEDIQEKTLRLPAETPLVGFHGMVDAFGIVSLGPILLDTLDPVCQQPLNNSNMAMYWGMDEFQKSKALEDSITEDERVRAQALEAILIYDSMVKAN